MENILDEQLKERKVLERTPLVIYFLITAIFIYLIGVLFKIQSWPYGTQLVLIGIFAIVITGVFSFKAFKAKNDFYLNLFYFLFLLGGFSTIMQMFVNYNYQMFVNYNNNFIGTGLNFGAMFFKAGVLLTLVRYFTLKRTQKASLNIIRYPLLVVIPIWIIGFFFKMQSWPYGSELLTISVFVFLVGTIIMLILRYKKELQEFRLITVWFVIMANMLALGLLFKVQSWPYALELIMSSFFGGALGIMFKLMKQQKLLKEQEKNEDKD